MPFGFVNASLITMDSQVEFGAVLNQRFVERRKQYMFFAPEILNRANQ